MSWLFGRRSEEDDDEDDEDFSEEDEDEYTSDEEEEDEYEDEEDDADEVAGAQEMQVAAEPAPTEPPDPPKEEIPAGNGRPPEEENEDKESTSEQKISEEADKAPEPQGDNETASSGNDSKPVTNEKSNGADAVAVESKGEEEAASSSSGLNDNDTPQTAKETEDPVADSEEPIVDPKSLPTIEVETVTETESSDHASKDPTDTTQPATNEQPSEEEEDKAEAVVVEDNNNEKEDSSPAANDTTPPTGHEETTQTPDSTATSGVTKTPDNNELEKKQEDNAATAKEEEDNTDQETEQPGEGGEVEEVTSTHEKRSLLVLAAEHDRVDILKAILADDNNNGEEPDHRDTLLNSSIPPLHISITYGSTNAVQCLLRMGADPSVRPNVQKIKDEADAGEEEQLVDIPNMGRFDNLSAWELAFGKENDAESNEDTKKKSGGWFSSNSSNKSSNIDIAPSKLEGIRHAFTAEALRCIGSDEADRLEQLLNSGMPSTIDIGGKNLYDWSVEMGALQCEELLRPAEAKRNSNTSEKEESSSSDNNESSSQNKSSSEAGSTAVLDRTTPGGTESLSQLNNRIDELESLSKALSSCLDNLAEEVSVCHGLLLMGGGATALASHVRSLKALKENKAEELERFEEAWENSEDELAYWAKECGEEGKEIAELMSTAIIASAEKEMNDRQRQEQQGSSEEEQAQKQQLKAQAAALENKIRKLRASITDLSEESTRDLEEVERRGLTGGIKLVRTLREEIRELEFALNEAKSAEALCRAKIKVIQSKMGATKKESTIVVQDGGQPVVVATGNPTSDEPAESVNKAAGSSIGENTATTANHVAPIDTSSKEENPPIKTPVNGGTQHQSATTTTTTPVLVESSFKSKAPRVSDSQSIASGQSNAVALKKPNSHGYFTVDLWEILLRIIGLGSSSSSARQSVSSAGSASTVMIV